jgi:tRNA dimethylallyltransferase
LSSNASTENPVIIHIIAGPTASGKSGLALKLAHEHNGVIINCDSMQVYDALHVLTAQPSKDDRAVIPHKLYSVLQPDEECSAGIWRDMAEAEIENAITEDRTPIICGGTGLYIKVLMEGLSPIPKIPKEVREAANKRQQELGNPGFYEEIKERDPESAARFHPQHTARLIRAWEVLAATGRTLSEWQRKAKKAPPAHWNFEIHKVMPEREELYRRCDERFVKMLENGALEEVRKLSAEIDNGDVPPEALIAKALGYTHLRDYLHGKIAREKAIELGRTETRQYAKRQMTWFRNQL